jgi:hypothetical protein
MGCLCSEIRSIERILGELRQAHGDVKQASISNKISIAELARGGSEFQSAFSLKGEETDIAEEISSACSKGSRQISAASQAISEEIARLSATLESMKAEDKAYHESLAASLNKPTEIGSQFARGLRMGTK